MSHVCWLVTFRPGNITVLHSRSDLTAQLITQLLALYILLIFFQTIFHSFQAGNANTISSSK